MAALTRQVESVHDRVALGWFILVMTGMFLSSIIFIVWLVLYRFYLS